MTCTAIALAILQHPRQRHSRERAAQAQQIVAEHIGQHQAPLALLEVGHGLERIAGKRSERSAETYDHQQPPAWVQQDALAGPNDEEAHNKTAQYVDDERAGREDWTKFSGSQAAEEISKVGARDRGEGYSKKVFHDGISYKNSSIL